MFSIPIFSWRYVADRSGTLSYANLPVMWIFAGRNNILLWATGWDFSTFSIFHRHIGIVATVQAIVHDVAYTVEELAGEMSCNLKLQHEC
ncbi:Ferric reductase transmembrane component [Lachnellula occidentalis]|uniref:Ferric reductase transmembrane component n=1 Tax=Lachnellula occidentalis TaxID=215460 RepID=A0A8H8UCD3_9HELO|nr:Ferric reductase transmembrane component [Lachnellula occidentalis]